MSKYREVMELIHTAVKKREDGKYELHFKDTVWVKVNLGGQINIYRSAVKASKLLGSKMLHLSFDIHADIDDGVLSMKFWRMTDYKLT